MRNKFVVDDDGVVQVVRQRIRKWTNYSRVLDSKPERISWSEEDLAQLIYFTKKGRPLPIDNCVPDMVMSMQDIFERYKQGREIPTVLAQYDSDELDAQMPDFSRMSKVELADLMKTNNQRIENWRLAKEAADQAAAEKAVAERNQEFMRLRKLEEDFLKKQEFASMK
ncbi:MAG: hypothetical protein [Microviridae sp.]|nr:MAG: hypothetical protein [Microviridae sp.]